MLMKSIRKYASSGLLLGGVALMLTAGLITLTNPVKVILFMTTYTGSLSRLCNGLSIIGVISASLGYALR